MANEEIVVKFGSDLSGLAAGLRGLKGMVSSAAHSAAESMKEAFRSLAAPLTVAGAVEGVRELFRGLMEDVKNIKRISESTGLDTGITQDFLNLGKAAGISGDAIEAAMDKFVKGLAPGSDPTDALEAIADKMASIEDPATRAAIATDAFGKSGVKLIPILAQGSEGVKKLAEEWGKLDEVQMAQIEHANQTLEKTGSRMKMQLANDIDVALETKNQFKKLPTWQKFLPGGIGGAIALYKAYTTTDISDEQPDTVTSAAKKTPAEINKAKIDAGAKAAKELAEKEEYFRAKPEEKVLMLTRQILALRRQMEDTTDEEERAKLGEKVLDIEGKRQAIQKEIASKAEEQDRKQKQAAQEILKTKEQIAKLGRDGERERMSEFLPTLQDLAQSGYSYFQGNQWKWQQGPFAQMAQRELYLENDAKQSLIWGNKNRFKGDVSEIEEIKKSLREFGVMAPDDKLTQLNDQMRAATDHLKGLNEKAGGTGLKVIGPED